ncbi:MAG: dehydrogenase [Bacteroidales bacterium]|nr:dehydrogenase [Bacteroidales bacterium]
MTVCSKAPLRLGLAGGGSDVSPYSDIYGGNVLNATINLSAYCTIEPLNEPVIEVRADDAGISACVPMNGKTGAQLIDGVIARMGPLRTGFRIHTWNDAPAGSGLGTSSTMVVAILKCFSEWLERPIDTYTLARTAYEIERIDLALAGGKQDQYAAAFGGFNFMSFNTDDTVTVTPVALPEATENTLRDSMLLYFTGRSRESAAIISEQQNATRTGKTTAVEAMHRIKQSAFDMREALLDANFKAFADILGRAWEDKKKMASSITNPMIQTAFDTAMAAGAISGKVSGAGGGGFIMLMVPPERKAIIADALSRLPGEVRDFHFTHQGAVSWKQ